jgi:hypothetical protein
VACSRVNFALTFTLTNIVTRLQAESLWETNFYFLQNVRIDRLFVTWYAEDIKRPRREANQPHILRIEIRNAWSSASTPQHVFIMDYIFIILLGARAPTGPGPPLSRGF